MPNDPPMAPNNTREMFVDLLLDPYMAVDFAQYGASTAVFDNVGANGLVWRIFRGDDSLMMGRPKFLSDQVFNKALFGTLYDTPYVYDETGPPGAGRMTRGQQRQLATNNAPGGEAPSREKPAGARYTHIDETSGMGPAALRVQARETFGLLTYPEDKEGGALAYVDPGGPDAPGRISKLEAVGKARFDTRLVRNLFFITNVQRVLRLRLSQELTEYRNVLVKSHNAVNAGITEYGTIPAGAVVRGYPQGPQEVVGTRRYDNQRGFFA